MWPSKDKISTNRTLSIIHNSSMFLLILDLIQPLGATRPVT